MKNLIHNIIRSYEIEYDNDLYISKNFNVDCFFIFKVLKQRTLNSFFFNILSFIYIFFFCSIFKFLFECLFCSILILFKRFNKLISNSNIKSNAECVLVFIDLSGIGCSRFLKHKDFISKKLSNSIEDKIVVNYSFKDLISNNHIHYTHTMLIKAFLISLKILFSLYVNIFKKPSKKNISIILHSNDVFKLLIFNDYYNYFSNIIIDCHYERWNYIVSNLHPQKHNVLQHGFIAKDINFSSNFGSVKSFFVYDFEFYEILNIYYHDISDFYLLKPCKSSSLNKKEILLLSSPLFINKELEFLLRFSELFPDYTIFVKMHPLYNDYSDKFSDFDLKFTDDFTSSYNVVTYNSFSGYELASEGHSVFFLENNTFENYLKGFK